MWRRFEANVKVIPTSGPLDCRCFLPDTFVKHKTKEKNKKKEKDDSFVEIDVLKENIPKLVSYFVL